MLYSLPQNVKSLILIGAILIAGIFIGIVAAEHPTIFLVGAVAALGIFTLSFIHTELGLYILIFSMLLSPEIGVGGIEGRAALGRGVTIRLDDLLLAVIGISWLAKNAIHKELGLFQKTKLNRAIFYYLSACIVSTGIGIIFGNVSPKTGFFFVLKYFEYFIVFFMVVNHLDSTDQLNRFIFCMLLTCFLVSIVGISQIPGGGRVSAPFEGEVGEPNTFGGYLVLIGSVAAGMFLQAPTGRIKLFLTGMIAIIPLPLFYTASRSSYLAALVAVLVLAWMSKKRMIAVSVVILGVALSPLLVPSVVKERVTFTFKQREYAGQVEIGGIRLDTSTSARINSWIHGFRGWLKRPIFGHGVTGYSFMDAQYFRVLVETGLIGMTAFLYLLYMIFKETIISYREVQNPYYHGLVRGYIAGYIGLLFHAIGANTFIIVRIMEPFWLLTGIVMVLPMLEKGKETAVYRDRELV